MGRVLATTIGKLGEGKGAEVNGDGGDGAYLGSIGKDARFVRDGRGVYLDNRDQPPSIFNPYEPFFLNNDNQPFFLNNGNKPGSISHNNSVTNSHQTPFIPQPTLKNHPTSKSQPQRLNTK